MIPKILHYVWLGERPLPEKFKNYIDGWKKVMPDYEIKEWNENNFDLSVCGFAKEALECGKFAFASDFIRVAVLKEYGGIYLDIDVEVLKPFDSLLSDSLFLGFENDGHVESAVIGCEPDHPLINTMYSYYMKASFVINGKENITPNVIYLTYFLKRDYGLIIDPVTQRLKSTDGSEAAVYSTEYFSPLDFNTQKKHTTENSYAVHHFANSWSPKSLKATQRFVNGVRKVFGRRFFRWVLKIYSDSECKKAEKYINSLN